MGRAELVKVCKELMSLGPDLIGLSSEPMVQDTPKARQLSKNTQTTRKKPVAKRRVLFESGKKVEKLFSRISSWGRIIYNRRKS